jgi:[ribosomal protein S5]-alanine N-acetyltransferase
MLTQPILETTRLILRPLTLVDAPSIQRIASIREIADTMISIPHPYPDGEAIQYIQRQITEYVAGHSVVFALDRQPDREFIGVIEMREIDREHAQAELSFWLSPQVWGQGYMSEALQPIMRYGFEDLELNRLYAYHMVRNLGSGKVLQKNGFELEGVLHQRVRKWGVFEDVKLWAMLYSDWQNLELDN